MLSFQRQPRTADVVQCCDFSEPKLLIIRLFMRFQAIFSSFRRIHCYKNSFPLFDLDQSNAIAGACHANASQEQTTGQTDPVQPKHRSDVFNWAKRNLARVPAFPPVLWWTHYCSVGDTPDKLGLKGVGNGPRGTIAFFDLHRPWCCFGGDEPIAQYLGKSLTAGHVRKSIKLRLPQMP